MGLIVTDINRTEPGGKQIRRKAIDRFSDFLGWIARAQQSGSACNA